MNEKTVTATHKLDNGWTVIEYDHQTRTVYPSKAKLDDSLIRVTAQIVYVPSERVVRCYHYAGATPQERAGDLRVAFANAQRAKMATHRGCWRRTRHKSKPAWLYSVSIGLDIDELTEFESIARHLEDEIFTSITNGTEVAA